MVNRFSPGCGCECTPKKIVHCTDDRKIILPAGGGSEWSAEVAAFRALPPGAGVGFRNVLGTSPDDQFDCDCETFNGTYLVPVGGFSGEGLPSTSGPAGLRVDYDFAACDYREVGGADTRRERLQILIRISCSQYTAQITKLTGYKPGFGGFDQGATQTVTYQLPIPAGTTLDTTQPQALPATSLQETNGAGRDYTCLDWPAGDSWPFEGDPSISPLTVTLA